MIRIVAFRRSWVASVLTFGLGLVSILPSVPAEAQCDLTQAPYQFAPPQVFPRMGLRATVFSLNLAQDRSTPMLSIKYNYGFMTWNLVNGSPAPGEWTLKDLRDAPEKYPVSGDSGGRSGETVLSTDGARALTGWNDPGFGVVAMTLKPNGYSGGGDYPPGGSANAVVKLAGPRYLAFSGNSVGSIYVADVTNIQTSVPALPANSIPSELARRMVGTWATLRVTPIEGGSQTFVGVSTVRGVAIGKLLSPGAAVPNISTNFVWYEFSAAALGLPADKKLRWADFAVHPVDGGIYILAEAYTGGTTGDYAVAVSLSRMTPETGVLEVQGVYTPATNTIGWPQGALVPSDTGLLAFFLHNPPGSTVSKLHVRPSGSGFATDDLAQNISWSVPKIDDFRVQKYGVGKYTLYLANTDYVEAAQVTCAQGPTPAVATLRVRTVSRTGVTVEVPDNGTAFLGDKLRVEPSFSPSAQVLLDWGLDYNYHGLGSLDYTAAVPNLAQADVSGTEPSVPLSQYTVYGPCDNRAGGIPSDGTACWTSVTNNSTQTTGAPPAADFPPDPAAGFSKQLKTAFEVRNALNPAGTSSIAEHRINWKVPAARLKSTAILSGGIVTDDSEGSPIPTGYKWYFASTPGASTLTLRASCTGNTCNPGLSLSGSYRYWVTASYDGGFTTPGCPGLSGDGQTCSGDPLKTVSVTDVVLGFAVPGTVYVGTGSFSVPSSSLKGAVEGCDGVSGFSYDLCSGSGAACTEGGYTGTGLALSGDPFAGGSLSIPKPAEGTWGIRIRYQYAPAGGCASKSTATWPADGSAAPVVVSRTLPTIQLTNSSGVALCSYHPIYGEICAIETGLTGKAYAYVDGVQDPAPPPISWTFGSGATGTGQGASFSYSTAGTYTVTLNGYGSPVTRQISVSAPSGGGGDPLGVSSFSVSNQSPATGTTVTFSCSANGGTPPYQYRFDYGDGQTRGFSSSSTANHGYSTAGTYYAFCQVSDAALNSGQSSARVVTVTQGGGGVPSACSLSVKDAQQGLDLQLGMGNKYYVNSGQLIRLEATDVTGTVNWAYGDGRTDSGTPKTFSYSNTSSAAVDYTLTMTSGASCTVSRNFSVSPATGPDFGVYAVVGETETPVAWDPPNSAFSVTSGQMLRFKATGTTGAVSWSFGDGTSSTETNATKIYSEPVDKLYAVTLSADGKAKTKNVLVKGSTGAPLTGAYSFVYADGKTVNPSDVEVNKPIRFTAADNADVYVWEFGDNSGSSPAQTQGSPKEHTFTRGGNFTVKLTTSRTGVAPVTSPSPTTFTVKVTDPPLWVAGGMVYADGQGGERWQSDLSIFNPGTETAAVSIAFVSGAGWAGVPADAWKALPPLLKGETRAFQNVLGGFFGLAKGAFGVVLVRSDSGPTPPVVVSRTYNAADAETKGTFGLSVPAMSVASGVRPASAAAGGNFLADLRHDATFRTNLVVANLKDETAEVEVTFRDGAGNVLGSPARITVEARGVKQLNSALVAPVAGAEAIGGAGYSGTAAHFSAEVTIKKGSGVYPYATVIDAGTGDSIVVTPAPRPSPTYRLPGIVRVKGKNDKYWVSDVAILNPGVSTRKIRVTYSYVRSGTTLRIDASRTITLAAHEMLVGVDFVRTWLELAEDDPYGYASSYVDFEPAPDDPAPAEPLVVTGKTYTPSGAGSVGLQVDAFVLEDGVSAQGSRRKLALSGLDANAKYRTNVALFLTPGSTGGVQVDVRVLNALGVESKKISFVGLDATNPFVQLNSSDLFAGMSTDETSRATVVIDSPRGTGLVGAYATVIDNLSEDATFVAGQLVP